MHQKLDEEQKTEKVVCQDAWDNFPFGYIHFDDITEISASSFKSKGMYLQVIYTFKLSMLSNL